MRKRKEDRRKKNEKRRRKLERRKDGKEQLMRRGDERVKEVEPYFLSEPHFVTCISEPFFKMLCEPCKF
jgi:hypothetical protein